MFLIHIQVNRLFMLFIPVFLDVTPHVVRVLYSRSNPTQIPSHLHEAPYSNTRADTPRYTHPQSLMH